MHTVHCTGTWEHAIKNIFNNTICGPNVVRLTAERGEITSPNYPEVYPAMSNCRYLIEVTDESRVELKLNEFLTERFNDYLRVYDGSSNSSKMLGSWSGNKTNETLISTKNQMFLMFTSDKSNIYSGAVKGFKASYRSVNESGNE